MSLADVRRAIGEGRTIVLATLPAVAAAIALSAWHPEWFSVSGPVPGGLGAVMLALGLPMWGAAVVLVARHVPAGRLVTSWPFSWVRHPLYTGVGLLVIPGLGLLLGSWVWAPVGLWLYLVSRVRARREEAALEATFGAAYRTYRERVLLPWL